MGDIAANIYKATGYLSEVWEQAQLLVNTIQGDFSIPGWAPEGWDVQWACEITGRINTSVRLTRIVRRSGGRGKPAKIGTLTVVVDIGYPNGIAALAGQAVIVVAWGCDSVWSFDDFAVESQPYWHTLAGEKVIRWIGGDFLDNTQPSLDDIGNVSWFYAFPLDAVAKTNDVQRLIAKPLEMITTRSVDDAFSGIPVLTMNKQDGCVTFSEG